MCPYLAFLGRIIPTYGLLMATGLVASFVMAFFRVRKAQGDTDALFIIAALAIGAALAGAKLLYLLVSYTPSQLWAALKAGDFSVLSGSGLVFYGGLLGGILGALAGVRLAGVKSSFSLYCNAIVPAIPLGHTFGRLGCFMSGCCYGLPYSGPFSVRFIRVGITEPVFPVQLLEAALNLLLCLFLLHYTTKTRSGAQSLWLYTLLYAVLRFLLEFLRGDSIRGFIGGLSISQWLSAWIALASVACQLIYRRRIIHTA